ncbi:MAG: L,D-transpeptidase family protein [Nitrospinae bacterium]|nr:L,D-transpeptidase family protein [Nitrospinota bacterium]
MALLVVGFLVYEFALDPSSRKKVDLVYYSGLRKIGIDTNPDIEKIKKDLTITATKLEKVQQVKDQIQQDLTVASSKLEKVQQVKDQIQQDLTVASSKLEKVQQVKDQIQQDLTVASSKLEKVQQDKKKILRDLTVTSSQLEKVQHEKRELTQVVETMILNNKVTENLKYIIRQIYDDPQTQYVLDNDTVTLNFNGKKIASYSTDPDKWYLLGILDSGVTRIFYDDKEILEIETIFGRKGEETPLGEYEIKNRLHNPTWYKKETINGQTIVRPIPFGDPDHEIGHWWLGLKTLDKSVSGSYGIHGVNANKVNDFFKKNFDWRNGSAGCLNIQRWFLEFLANTVPLGAKVNIVPKDKWNRNKIHDPHSAA